MRCCGRAATNFKPVRIMADDILSEVLAVTVNALDAQGIEYAVTGSVASSVHGEPFASMDVDIAVRMTVEQARQLAQTLPRRFYRSDEAMIEAARNGTMTNLVDTETNLKVDLCVLLPSRFHDSVFARRVRRPLLHDEPTFHFVSAEDVILMKLLWRKDSRSQKQWDNALSVVRVQGARLDWKYLFDQARELDLVADLTALRDEGGV